MRWLESVEEDLKNMGMRKWRHKLQVQECWRTILEEAKVHKRLQCMRKNKMMIMRRRRSYS
jgi:hypothetical protein